MRPAQAMQGGGEEEVGDHQGDAVAGRQGAVVAPPEGADEDEDGGHGHGPAGQVPGELLLGGGALEAQGGGGHRPALGVRRRVQRLVRLDPAHLGVVAEPRHVGGAGHAEEEEHEGEQRRQAEPAVEAVAEDAEDDRRHRQLEGTGQPVPEAVVQVSALVELHFASPHVTGARQIALVKLRAI